MYKTYTLGGGAGSGKSMFNCVSFQCFGPIFVIFIGNFGYEKMLMCTLFGGRRGSRKVYGLYTRENVDNYGRPLSLYVFCGLSTVTTVGQ